MNEICATEAFARLTPDNILNAVEAVGIPCNGRFLALNSYENRVYQIGLEEGAPLVAKFYRPQRWSDEAILEEHRFTLTLAEHELPVVPPLLDVDGRSLYRHGLYRFALYPSRGGRAPDLENPDHLEQLGRLIGRIHALGSVRTFEHRPTLDIESFAVRPHRFLLERGFIPDHLQQAYETLITDLIPQIRRCFARAGSVRSLRLHGDCHPGNILWHEDRPYIVDFDDARMGPAIQDLWMFLSGDRNEMSAGLADLLEGYTRFYEFNAAELHLTEALRTLRIIHYAGWLALRWDDPAFPIAFPWFNSFRYWEEHILSLREQFALMDEPPLIWN